MRHIKAPTCRGRGDRKENVKKSHWEKLKFFLIIFQPLNMLEIEFALCLTNPDFSNGVYPPVFGMIDEIVRCYKS